MHTDYILGLNDNRHLNQLELLINEMDPKLQEVTVEYIKGIIETLKKK